jgi:hypothetical protein
MKTPELIMLVATCHSIHSQLFIAQIKPEHCIQNCSTISLFFEHDADPFMTFAGRFINFSVSLKDFFQSKLAAKLEQSSEQNLNGGKHGYIKLTTLFIEFILSHVTSF